MEGKGSHKLGPTDTKQGEGVPKLDGLGPSEPILDGMGLRGPWLTKSSPDENTQSFKVGPAQWDPGGLVNLKQGGVLTVK